MFPDLETVAPFVPDDRFIAEVRRRVAARRRRIRVASTSLVVALVVLVGGSWWYVDHRLSSIQRIDLGTESTSDPVSGGRAFNVLIAGVDPNGMPDAVAVARFVPTDARVEVLQLPRDLILGPDRKVSSSSLGQLRADVTSALGIPVDHVVSLSMDGFVRIADRVGFRLDVSMPVRDGSAGLSLPAGCHTLRGSELLALIRSRHLEVGQPDGRWLADPTADLGRMARRDQLLAPLLEQLRAADVSSLHLIDDLVDELQRSGTVDSALTNGDLLRIGRLVSGSSSVRSVDLPVVEATGPDGAIGVQLGGDPEAVTSALAGVGGHLAGQTFSAGQLGAPLAPSVSFSSC